jgi:hypothetical protein
MALINILSKILKAYREGGFRLVTIRAIRKFHDFMEPILPVAEKVSYNGVIVDENKVFSKLLGTNKTDEPDFEEKNVEAIKSHVKPNDEVLIIGGGWGVTAFYASNITQRGEGKTKVVEASSDQIESLREVCQRDGMEDVELIHGVVGNPKKIWGEKKNPKRFYINDFDPDVIQMDIEGSECEVLKVMKPKARVVIVESHGEYGCGSDEVKTKLDNCGYEVENLGPERDKEKFKKNDVKVLVGKDRR